MGCYDRKGPRMRSKLLPLTVFSMALRASPVFAHHPLDGMPMETFSHGILSGFGHPILGFDHLFFVIAMGLAAGLSGTGWAGIATYMVAMLAGCFLVSVGGSLPAKEVLITLSLISIGGVVASQRDVPSLLLTGAFGGFGLFHGAAYGGSIAGQEGGAPLVVLVGYLLGLGITQTGIAFAAGLLTTRTKPMTVRLGGAMVAGIGLFLLLEQVEGAFLS